MGTLSHKSLGDYWDIVGYLIRFWGVLLRRAHFSLSSKMKKFGIQQLRILILMPSYFIFDSSIFWYKGLVGFPKTLSIPIKTLYLECKTHGPIENVCTQIILPKYMLCTVPTYVLLVGGEITKRGGSSIPSCCDNH